MKLKKEMAILIGLIIIIFAGAAVAMTVSNNMSKKQEVVEEPVVEEKQEEVVEEPKEKTVESFTGLLIGFDKSKKLTDVILVAHFDAKTKRISFISVPRDLLIDFKKEPFKTIKKEDPDNHIGHCKLTEVYSYLGRDQEDLKTVESIVSEIVGLDIDYMATIDVDQFVDVINAMGGLDFNVPQRMYYRDPTQDLYINLQKGVQHLDGEQVMGLCRYRKYRMGDLQRIEVQHDVMTALYQKVINNLELNQMVDLAKTIYGMVDTDFGVAVALDYVEYFYNLKDLSFINTDNMITVPSWNTNIQEGKYNISYQDFSVEKTRKAVDELLNPPVEEVEKVDTDSTEIDETNEESNI